MIRTSDQFRMNARFPQSGFSMVELLTVLAVLALLTSLIVPAVSSLNRASSFRHDVAELGAMLREARAYAMANRTRVRAAFAPEDDRMVVLFIAASGGGITPGADAAMEDPDHWRVLNRPRRLRLVITDEALDTGSGQNSPLQSTFGTLRRSVGKTQIETDTMIEFGPTGEARVLRDFASRFVGIPLVSSLPGDTSTDAGDVLWINAANGRIWAESASSPQL
jgi:prepilin-type N-terminal cleavage/methylation domain-containing protein